MYIPDDETWSMLDPVDAMHVAVSLVVLANNEGQLQVLMQENEDGPYTGEFVLPSAIVRAEQTADEAARELYRSYGFLDVAFQQSACFSHTQIDPRGRVMTIGYVGAVPRARLAFVAASNNLALIDITMDGEDALLSLDGMSISIGYLHDGVVSVAVENLRNAVGHSLLPFAFLEEAFIWAEYRSVHDALFGKEHVPQLFRQKYCNRVFPGDQMIVGTGLMRRGENGKPSELFKLAYVSPDERSDKGRRAREAGKMARRGPPRMTRRGL